MPVVFRAEGYVASFYSLAERPRATRARYEARHIVVELTDGRTVRFPVTANDRLRAASPEQLSRIELSPFGLHWPDLDEDLSLQGILDGRYGRQPGLQSK